MWKSYGNLIIYMQKFLRTVATLRFAHITIPLKGHDPPRDQILHSRVSQKIHPLATNFPDLQKRPIIEIPVYGSDKLEVAGTHPVYAMYTFPRFRMDLGAEINIISYGH